jgi:hypothetical protein
MEKQGQKTSMAFAVFSGHEDYDARVAAVFYLLRSF